MTAGMQHHFHLATVKLTLRSALVSSPQESWLSLRIEDFSFTFKWYALQTLSSSFALCYDHNPGSCVVSGRTWARRTFQHKVAWINDDLSGLSAHNI